VDHLQVRSRDVLRMDLADDDAAARRHFFNGETGSQAVVGRVVLPVVKRTGGVGLTQLAARVGAALGGTASDRRPEHIALAVALEVLALVALTQLRGGNGNCRGAFGNGQVPGYIHHCCLPQAQPTSNYWPAPTTSKNRIPFRGGEIADGAHDHLLTPSC